ncbi:hypothetical protein ACEQ8H_004566 [Pleosporales sp. CAS-2024a]
MRELRDTPSRRNRGGSVRQRQKNNAIAHISRGWPSWAVEQRTRGLGRPGNECYRREMVKAYLHCPRLINWLDHHHTNGYVCEFHADRRHRPARRCPACAFKKLAKAYWTRGSTAATIDQKLLEMDQAGFWHGLPSPWTASTTDQEDASQYAAHLATNWAHCNRANSKLHAWHAQADAMFKLDYVYETTCSACHRTTTSSLHQDMHWPLRLPPSGRTTLDAAIDADMTDHVDKYCPACSPTTCVPHTRTKRLHAGPEILTIQLLIYALDPTTYSPRKTNTKLVFSPTLDLSRHLHLPQLPSSPSSPSPSSPSPSSPSPSSPSPSPSPQLTYRLAAVTSHAGPSTHAGHYMGQLRSASAICKTNDAAVVRSSRRDFTQWPQVWPGDGASGKTSKRKGEKKKAAGAGSSETFTPYILTWVMSRGN